ncbi:MAG: hypothetical protein ACTSYU_13515 [Promethearchaeota archaeon]
MGDQINFRVKRDEKAVIDTLARLKGTSTAEFAKSVVLKDIRQVRVDLAFSLLKEGKIGKKRAWLLSGLDSFEFMSEWTKRKAEEHIPEILIDKEIELLDQLDLTQFFKEKI